MPKGGSKLNGGEKLLLKLWLEAGAPGPPPLDQRPFISAKVVQDAITKHLTDLPPKDRPFQRDLTLTHLHNNPLVYNKDLLLDRAALAKLVNSTTRKKELVVLKYGQGKMLSGTEALCHRDWPRLASGKWPRPFRWRPAHPPPSPVAQGRNRYW